MPLVMYVIVMVLLLLICFIIFYENIKKTKNCLNHTIFSLFSL